MSSHNHLQEGLIAEYTMPATVASDAIVPDRDRALVEITTLGAETRTLPIPLNAGVRLTIVLAVDGGDCVITAASAINIAGNTIITLDTAGDFVELVSVTIGGVLFWRVVANDGAALS